MYRTILVPLDGSNFGEQALPLALSIGRRARASLRLLHVHAPFAAVYAEGHLFVDDTLDRQWRDQQQTYLNRTVEKIRSVSPVPVDSLLLDGEVVPTLRHVAQATGVDLVVMTTHGRGTLGRWWLGSVADQLVRELPMPVLLVHPTEYAPDLRHEPVLRHLLLPLDGTPLAEQMIEPAVNFGTLMDADYTLLRVIKPMLPVNYQIEGGTLGQMARSVLDQIDTVQGHLRREAEGYLDKVSTRLQQRGLRVRARVEVEDQPAVAVLKEAVPPAIDAVALETHGRRGLTRLFLGSVADKVIRGAAVPVLVHRPVSS